GELADQRLCLAEECERLARAHQHWNLERAQSFDALESLGQQLHEREQALQSREQELERGEYELRRRFDDVSDTYKQLEAFKAQALASGLAWEAERGRMLAEVQIREESAHRHLTALAAMRERWDTRRRRQLEYFRKQQQ